MDIRDTGPQLSMKISLKLSHKLVLTPRIRLKLDPDEIERHLVLTKSKNSPK